MHRPARLNDLASKELARIRSLALKRIQDRKAGLATDPVECGWCRTLFDEARTGQKYCCAGCRSKASNATRLAFETALMGELAMAEKRISVLEGLLVQHGIPIPLVEQPDDAADDPGDD